MVLVRLSSHHRLESFSHLSPSTTLLHPPDHSITMPNVSLIYNKPPHGEPIPGETLKRVSDDDFDPDTVDLNGGILINVKALSIDPYMRGSSPSTPSHLLPLRRRRLRRFFSAAGSGEEAGSTWRVNGRPDDAESSGGGLDQY